MDKILSGWKKDPFDYAATYHKPEVAKLPEYASLYDYVPYVRHQRDMQSCVGFGMGGALTATIKQYLGMKSHPEWFSPQWIWNGARNIEHTLTQNVGVYPRDAIAWLQTQGMLLEHFWPYSPVELDAGFPSKYADKAILYPEFKAIRVDNGVQGLMSALADGHVVAIGTPWPVKWIAAPQGVLPEITVNDEILGGHATFIYAYSNMFAIQNSWGDGWGACGRCCMPMQAFEVFKKIGGYDAHYFTFKLQEAKPGTSIWYKLCRLLKTS
jgi:hypothetical protein